MAARQLKSLELAVEAMRTRDPREMAALAGGAFDEGRGLLTLNFMSRPAAFDFGRSALLWADTGEEFAQVEAVTVLHYLLNAAGDQPSGGLVAYRDLWGAGTQSGPFVDRPEALLAEMYGKFPGRLLARGRELGAAVVEKYGDARIDLPVFPNLPLTVLLYAADDDLPAGAKILYDAVTGRYLPTEDAAWLAEYAAERLTAGLG